MLDNRGVTLTELITVMVIIAVGAAIAIPNLGPWMAKRELNSATRTLAAHFNQARSEAIRRNQNVTVWLNAGNETYTVDVADGTNIVPQTTLERGLDLRDLTFIGSSTGYNSRGISTNPGSLSIRSTRAPSGDNLRTMTVTIGGSVTIAP